jgi:hypothetical protein
MAEAFAALLHSGSADSTAMRTQVKRRAVEVWAWHIVATTGEHAACDESLVVEAWPVVRASQVPSDVSLCSRAACFGSRDGWP